jgi:hypothetical protein
VQLLPGVTEGAALGPGDIVNVGAIALALAEILLADAASNRCPAARPPPTEAGRFTWQSPQEVWQLAHSLVYPSCTPWGRSS